MSYMEERFQEGTLKKDTLSLENIINDYEKVAGLLAEKSSLQSTLDNSHVTDSDKKLAYEEAREMFTSQDDIEDYVSKYIQENSLSYERILEMKKRISQIDYDLSSYGEAQIKISRDLSNYDSCFSVKNVFDKFSEQIMKGELSEEMLLDICNMDKVLDASMSTKEELDAAVDKYIADCNQKIGEGVQGEHMKTEAVDKQEQEKIAKQEKELQQQNQNEEIVQHRLRRHR